MTGLVRRADGYIGVPSGKRSQLYDRDGFELCRWYLAERQMVWYFFGSGRVVGHVSALPIMLKLRWEVEDEHIFFAVPPGQWESLSMLLKKIVPQVTGPTTGEHRTGDAAVYPSILTYLTATAFPDGQARQTASLIILSEGNQWKGCLSDKENSRSLWKSGDTVADLLLAIEEGLILDDGWRVNYEARKGAAKKK